MIKELGFEGYAIPMVLKMVSLVTILDNDGPSHNPRHHHMHTRINSCPVSLSPNTQSMVTHFDNGV